VIAEHLYLVLAASILAAGIAHIGSWRYSPWTFHPNEDSPRARLPDKLDPSRLQRFVLCYGIKWATLAFAAGVYLK
jgi:hypothetical protein